MMGAGVPASAAGSAAGVAAEVEGATPGRSRGAYSVVAEGARAVAVRSSEVSLLLVRRAVETHAWLVEVPDV